MKTRIGARSWAIPEGYIAGASRRRGQALDNQETTCIFNACDQDAHVEIVILFIDRDPVGPYRLTVPALCNLLVRFHDLDDPAPIPRDTDFASIITSDVPIVVQHMRLDSREDALALLSTVAFTDTAAS